MIEGLHHISIIVKSENSVCFYKRLGYIEKKRIERGYDTIVYLLGHGMLLEMYIDSSHPSRINNPEALGLRHFGLKVDNIDNTLELLNVSAEPIREMNGKRYTFIHDPDGLPIELHE